MNQSEIREETANEELQIDYLREKLRKAQARVASLTSQNDDLVTVIYHVTALMDTAIDLTSHADVTAADLRGALLVCHKMLLDQFDFVSKSGIPF